jgi:hypothetical protein
MPEPDPAGWYCVLCYGVGIGARDDPDPVRGTIDDLGRLDWQATVCPDCNRRLDGDGGIEGKYVGAYADGRRDPSGGG